MESTPTSASAPDAASLPTPMLGGKFWLASSTPSSGGASSAIDSNSGAARFLEAETVQTSFLRPETTDEVAKRLVSSHLGPQIRSDIQRSDAKASPPSGTGGSAATSSSSSKAPPGLEAPGSAAPPGLDFDREGSSSKTKPRIYAPYVDAETLESGLKSGRFVRGQLRVNMSRPSIAFVKPEGSQKSDPDLVVHRRTARNRAMHMDIVVVEIIDEGEELLVPEESDEEGDGGAAASDSDEEVFLSRPTIDVQDGKKAAAKGAARGKGRSKGKGKDPKNSSGKYSSPCRVVAIAEKKGSDRVIVCTLHPNSTESRSLRRMCEGDEAFGKGSEGKGGHGDGAGADERPQGEVKAGDGMILAKPNDKRMPWLMIQLNDITRKALKLPGKLSKYELWPVQMMKWEETAHLPLGRLKGSCLGQAGDMEAETKACLLEHDLDSHDVDFEDDELDEVDAIVVKANASWESEASQRLDLRAKRICTIDPATAKDLDDAIHIDVDHAKREIEIGVHIADVGHFLKIGSIADTEAQRRTTSVYLIDRVLPMLPHALCNYLCSLNPNEPKLAFSVFFRLDMLTGNLIEDPAPWFKKTIIKSCCRMNYEEVQDVLDGKELEEVPTVYGGYTWDQIKYDISSLYKVCGKIRKGRLEGGALTITKTKMVFHTRESEDGIPTGYHLESHSASHWIIEELMLMANRCVAKYLYESSLSHVSCLRNHAPPDVEKSDKLDKMLKNLGIAWSGGRNATEIFKSCQAIYQKYGRMMGLCVEMMVMKGGMQQAEYFIVDENDEEQAGPHHFALNFEHYTHFTSPIRRYPDVMVHRVLAALLPGIEDAEKVDDGTIFQQASDAQNQCIGCNEKKLSSRKVQEQLDRAVFCVFLRAQKQWFYTIGTILEMKPAKNEGGKDEVTCYSSQLGREKKARLQGKSTPGSGMDLFMNGVEDVLMLPETWRFLSKGRMEIDWAPPDGGKIYTQEMAMLSSVPMVIIPIDTVPIDYAMFFVSPFHPRYQQMLSQTTPEAMQGFQMLEEEEEEGVEVAFNADA